MYCGRKTLLSASNSFWGDLAGSIKSYQNCPPDGSCWILLLLPSTAGTMPVGKCSRDLFKSCMASVFRGKQELGKTFHRNGITTQYIHVVRKHPHLSSSVIFSKVTLVLQIAFIAGWSVKPAHRRLPHCVGSPHTLPESPQHYQKLFLVNPSRDNTNSAVSHHPVSVALFS